MRQLQKPRPSAYVILSVALFPAWILIWATGVAITAQFNRTREFSEWLYDRFEQYRYGGFTLVELAIVLTVIGLVVGGVLVGQDLIKAAATRATIAQKEQYDSAVTAFRNKYNGLPGDLNAVDAGNFGFTVGSGCDGSPGKRDGNGAIDGWVPTSVWPLAQVENETGFFWVDLSTAGFINGSFPGNGATMINCNGGGIPVTQSGIGNYFPAAKLGGGNYFYVYEVNSINWFGVSAITSVLGTVTSNTSITVSQAYNIDKKIDDGLPTTGNVVAVYLNGSQQYTTPAPNGNPDTASTCYNNSTNTYSTNINNGSGPNCALSFKMQGAGR